MITPRVARTGSRAGTGPRAQRGIAMLVAILLVALGTILAAAIAYESAMSARRSTATFSFDEALLVDQGAEALAAFGLRAIRQQAQAGSGTANGAGTPTGAGAGINAGINLAQPWTQPVGPVEVVPGVTLEASLEDLQGRFNLNSLVISDGTAAGQPDPQAVQVFRRLLVLKGVEPKWADLLVDWIDADTNPLPDGAEDNAYLSQNPPYLTANLYITSTTELLALPGFGADRYAKIAPYVTALPPSVTQVNICTASGVVLDAFMFKENRTEFSLDLQGLAKNRASAGGCFPTLNDYQAAFGAPADFQALAPKFFAIDSHYFRLSSLVTIGTSEFNLYSLLFQDDNGGMVHTVLRSYSPD